MFVIDFEFSGLDNTYLTSNEIIESKLLSIATGKASLRRYGTSCGLSAHVLRQVEKPLPQSLFTRLAFEHQLTRLDPACTIDHCRSHSMLLGFGVQQDKLMLRKYGIDIQIADVQDMLRRSEYEYRLATEGHSLEDCAMIVLGRRKNIRHYGSTDELHIIAALYAAIHDQPLKEHLDIMPWGHCAGMPIKDYVTQYRRAADGYRFNNNDLLAASMTHHIPLPVYRERYGDDDDWEDDECE